MEVNNLSDIAGNIGGTVIGLAGVAVTAGIACHAMRMIDRSMNGPQRRAAPVRTSSYSNTRRAAPVRTSYHARSSSHRRR